jgi:hypothetical protein
MIGAEFYKGQGLGNQLWIYASVRCIAKRHGFEFGFTGTDQFKGHEFLSLDFGNASRKSTSNGPRNRVPKGFLKYSSETRIIHKQSGADISPVDSQILNVSDGTFIDGPLQAEYYLAGFKDDVSKWFNSTSEASEKCVISLRGGEYRGLNDVFLPLDYYLNAIDRVREIDPDVEFEVVTDDLSLANEYFPNLKATSSGGVKILFNKIYISPKSSKIGRDFAALQRAKYLILSNSSFSWWGAYTNRDTQLVIAPKYWARFNISDGYWSQGDSLTSEWSWLDRAGNFSTYEQCAAELTEYRTSNISNETK